MVGVILFSLLTLLMVLLSYITWKADTSKSLKYLSVFLTGVSLFFTGVMISVHMNDTKPVESINIEEESSPSENVDIDAVDNLDNVESLEEDTDTESEEDNQDEASESNQEDEPDLAYITNEQLSNLTPEELYALYSEEGQQLLDEHYGSEMTTAKEYGLTVIGKRLPEPNLILTDIEGNDIEVENDSVFVFLNEKENSEKFIEHMNNTDYEDGVDYFVLFPYFQDASVAEVSDLVKEKYADAIDDRWNIITITENAESDPNDPARKDLITVSSIYFSTVNAPSYASLKQGEGLNLDRITLGGLSSDGEAYEKFHNNMFNEPPLYQYVPERESVSETRSVDVSGENDN